MADFGTLISSAITDQISEIYTAAPAIITRVDMGNYTCDVKLKYKIKGKELILYGVPVASLTSNESAILITPKKGDVVLVMFTKHDLRSCLVSEEMLDSINELVIFKPANAVIVAGVFTKGKSIDGVKEDEILIKHHKGSEIRISTEGKITCTSPNEVSSITITDEKVLIESEKLIKFKAPNVQMEVDKFEVI